MKQVDFQSMSLDELWSLHENIRALLVERVEAELQTLQSRLTAITLSSGRERRPYPQVKPKFRNPENPLETWTGRGLQPKWVRDLLAAGMRIDDMRIAEAPKR
jgi:DNA-binding protein H-NS